MNKFFLILIVIGLGLLAFRSSSDHRLAQVNQAQGVLIFMQCSPVSDYTVLGTVKKTGVVWTGQPNEMFNIIMKRVKKEYPATEAVIFDAIDMEHATCIKFKE